MRLVSRLAPPTVIAALAATALALNAAPASAEPNDACATVTAIYESHMNRALFYIGLADTLASFGQMDLSNAAGRDADREMNMADRLIPTMRSAC